MQRYFAWVDTGHIRAIGVCADFEDADAKAPANTLWLFPEEDLRTFLADAQKVLVQGVANSPEPVDVGTGRAALDAAIEQYANLPTGMAVGFDPGAETCVEPECEGDHLVGYWVAASVFVPLHSVAKQGPAACEGGPGTKEAPSGNDVGHFVLVGHARGRGLPDLDAPVSVNGAAIVYRSAEEADRARDDYARQFGHNPETGHRTSYEVRRAAEVL